MPPKYYRPNAEDIAIASTFASLPESQQIGDYWGSDAVAPLKQRAKDHYIEEQKRKCCYCRKNIASDSHRLWDLEHVLPRKIYPQYMFEPRNLTVSCMDCNVAKASADVGKREKYARFPSRSSSYRIVHPHFDEFDDHIGIQFGLIYYSKNSEKGSFTIRVCNLGRYAQWFEEDKGPVADERYENDVTRLVFTKDKDEARVIMRKLLTAFDDDDI